MVLRQQQQQVHDVTHKKNKKHKIKEKEHRIMHNEKVHRFQRDFHRYFHCNFTYILSLDIEEPHVILKREGLPLITYDNGSVLSDVLFAYCRRNFRKFTPNDYRSQLFASQTILMQIPKCFNHNLRVQRHIFRLWLVWFLSFIII